MLASWYELIVLCTTDTISQFRDSQHNMKSLLNDTIQDKHTLLLFMIMMLIGNLIIDEMRIKSKINSISTYYNLLLTLQYSFVVATLVTIFSIDVEKI